MKKAVSYFLILLSSAWYVQGQANSDDRVATLILDRMTDVIGDLTSCSFKLTAQVDLPDPQFGLIKQFSDFTVYFSGPNKMLVNANGHKGHREYIYDGQVLSYYSFDEHNYGVIPAPRTTLRTIDSVHDVYDIEFPAADFFYPAFTDDLIESSDSIRFAGLSGYNGKEYFHVVAYGKDKLLQFWISNDGLYLPGVFSITYKKQEGSPQYTAVFSDWQLNPVLPDGMFEFTPPPGASNLRIMSKNDQ